MQDKTLLVITHRFAALELVDRVLVLNNGKINYKLIGVYNVENRK